MRYLSVCSGIEAASVAWKHLGWNAVAFSEIEAFPSKVLAHHYPDVPNLGDMTLLTQNEYLNGQQINLLVGGTPCQSFSVAGLRAGLADERGNLSLEYIRLLEHKRPKWFLWENVPGVLSSNGGADFASILSGWTGRDIAPQRFEISGIIEGEFYSVAWRVLDSQYFGVPQRRRRIFVVGHLGGDWRPPTAVLFEQESLSRDFTPIGSKRKKSTTSAERGSGAGNIDCSPNGISGAMTSKWAKGTGGPAGDEHYNLIVQDKTPANFRMVVLGEYADDNTASTMKKRDYKDATDLIVVPAYGIQAGIVNRTENSGANGLGVKEEESFTLTKGDQHCVMQPIVYDTTQITHPKNGSNPQAVDPCHTLAKGGDATLLVQPVVIDRAAFNQGVNAKYDAQIEHSETAPCLVKVGPHAVYQPIILDDQGGNVMTVYDQGHTGTLRAQTHGHEPIVAQPAKCYVDNRRRGLEINDNISPTVLKFWGTGGGNAPFVQSSMVRRLTPLECERLQGFPDYFTAIPGASDSKRYAALGNSMTVNVMKWIGERIDMVDKIKRNLW